jgi:uncharacterized protein YbcI
MPRSQTDHSERGAMAAAIARSTVQLLSEYTGRGPTKARAYITSDLITVVLRDTMNHGERSLVREGKRELVLAVRKAYQDTMGPSLIEAVERHSGQQVLAFLSDNHLEPDIAVESFVMSHDGDGHAPALDIDAPALAAAKADGHRPDGHVLDGHVLDGHGPDGHVSDGQVLDGHAPDGHVSDGHVPDGHDPDGAAAEPEG